MDYKEKLNKMVEEVFEKNKTTDCISNKQQPLINTQKKILLVDDDQILCDMYSMKFQKNGYEIKAVYRGEDAINILKGGFAPDILVIDLMLPVMDGFAVFDSIKKEKLAPNAVAVMLTNKGLSEDINQAKEAGFNGFIVKATTTPAEVVEQVKKIYDDCYK